METLVAPTVNVVILIGILATALRKPLREFVSQRHHSLRTQIHEVREELRKAQQSLDEYSGKLKAVGAEIAAMQEQVRQDAQSMKQHIINESHKSAARIVSDAKQTSEALVADLRNQLRAELAAQVIDKAESMLLQRLTGDDRVRLRKEFSKQAEKME